ncbi:GMC family oxidoreductase [Fontimonas sp. SYSU GA230001]|uniref:GMC family oxidoreductase n=1 Tax=Fontimonas sp. SYSU GA230001 TaxID=3142450 RepID=UPI0032B5FC8B
MERYDAVIVGSGAGGGIAAYVLARGGMRVAVLEKGPWLTAEDFSDDELKTGERTFYDQDPLIEPRSFRDGPEAGDRQFVGQVLPVSRCVGGGSVHYGGVCFRFRPEDFRARSVFGNLSGADIVDWPLSDDELDENHPDSIWRIYDRLERLLGVAGGQMRGDADPGAPVPGAEWRRSRYPMPGHPANYGAKLFEQAARSLGLHPFPTPVCINNGRYTLDDPELLAGSAPLSRHGCSYCGMCSSHGCPHEAKGDTRVSALELAQRTGRCTILPDCNAIHVEIRDGRAQHVVYIDGRGRLQSVAGDRIVLACGVVDTPRLALLSEMPRDLVNHDVLGRYLTVHHFPGAIGIFQERIDFHRGFWSMRCLDDFYFGVPAVLGGGGRQYGFGNVQTIGPSSGYPLTNGGIIATAKFAPWGANHKTAMRLMFGHMQWFGMIGQDPPVATNRVDLDPSVTDAYGLPVARITYRHHPNDYAVAAQVLPHFAALLTAMGATSTQVFGPLVSPSAIPQFLPQDLLQRGPLRGVPNPIAGLQNHQHGTMRCGHDPDTSVVDAHCRFHGIPNLYIADGSVLPGSGGYNPTLTIQAMAWRTARAMLTGH